MTPTLRLILVLSCSCSLSACYLFEDLSRQVPPSGPSDDAGVDVGVDARVDVGVDVGCIGQEFDPALVCQDADVECGTVFFEDGCREVEIDCGEYGFLCDEGEECNLDYTCECLPTPGLPPEQLCENASVQCGDLQVMSSCGEPFDVTCGSCALGSGCLEGACVRDVIVPPETEPDGAFGYAISVTPGRIFVSQPRPLNPLSQGEVGLFERTMRGWVRTEAFKPQQPSGASDLIFFALFGYAVHANGDDLFVGAPGRQISTGPTVIRKAVGGVYHYTLRDGSWAITQLILPPGATEERAQGSTCGTDVVLDGDTLYVGCPGGYVGESGDLAPNQPGRVEVYTRPSATEDFVHTETLYARGDQLSNEQDMFGFALDVTSRALVVGAPNASSDSGVRTGAVVVFTRGQTHTVSGTLAPMGPEGAAYGFALDANETGLVIGAPTFDEDRDGRYDGSGSVTLQEGPPGGSMMMAPARFIQGAAGDGFGYSVAFSPMRILIGAPGYQGIGGAFRVARADFADLEEVEVPVPFAGNLTGYSVGITDTFGVVSSPGVNLVDGGGGTVDDAGQVLVFPWDTSAF